MRRFLIGAAVLACVAILACSSGGKSGDGGVVTPPPGPVPTFLCSDSPAAPNVVVLKCGARVSATVWRIDVVIGGPTASNINGFNFDVVFDPLVMAYVPDSAQMGTFFLQGGGTTLFLAATATNPPDPGRLVVGVQLQGSTGVGSMMSENLILAFQIKTLTASPFGPDQLTFARSEATDSLRMPIPGITFSDQIMLSFQ